MNKSMHASLLFAVCVAAGHASVWAQDKTYIVRFKDSAVPQVKAGTVRDDRVAKEPDSWGHVGERVVNHVQSLEKKHGIRAHAAFGTVFKGMSVRLTPAQVQALKRDPSVDLMEEEQTFSIDAQTTPWGISKTQATLSYTLAGNGSGAVSGVRAYVIDTGIDMANTDLNRAGFVNFVGDRKNTDCNGHGTHVAGTIAAIDNAAVVVGMAPGVPTYGVKVLDCRGSGSTTSVVQGLDWVAKNAIKPAVANMSLGGGVSTALDDAVRKLAATGVFVSIAAGNSAVDACTSSPARVGGANNTTALGVMTVAATDSLDAEASFSNYGNCVDIWAPGVSIPSLKLGGGIATMSGTSMAAPHVGGAAALYLGKYPTATSSSVVNTLKGMTISTGTKSKDGRAITRLNANVQ